MVFAREQWLALQHLREDTACAPDIHLHVVLLPGEHDFRGSVVPRRYIASHLWILNASQAEVADFEVAVLVDKDVGRLQVAVYHTGGVHIFKAALLNVRLRKQTSDKIAEY